MIGWGYGCCFQGGVIQWICKTVPAVDGVFFDPLHSCTLLVPFESLNRVLPTVAFHCTVLQVLPITVCTTCTRYMYLTCVRRTCVRTYATSVVHTYT